MWVNRKQRFEKVTKDLKVTRVFNTLVEEMKAIGVAPSGGCTEVMMPVALSKRSPVLLLMGGGMGAGKSTVLKDIMKEYTHFHSFYLLFSHSTLIMIPELILDTWLAEHSGQRQQQTLW